MEQHRQFIVRKVFLSHDEELVRDALESDALESDACDVFSRCFSLQRLGEFKVELASQVFAACKA